MAKTSRLVARQAQAMENQSELMTEVLVRLERIEAKLDELMQPLLLEQVGEWIEGRMCTVEFPEIDIVAEPGNAVIIGDESVVVDKVTTNKTKGSKK